MTQQENRDAYRAFYAEHFTVDADHWEDIEGADYDEESDRYYCPEGWHEEITSDHCDLFYPIPNPEGWQPLPEHPEE